MHSALVINNMFDDELNSNSKLVDHADIYLDDSADADEGEERKMYNSESKIMIGVNLI